MRFHRHEIDNLTTLAVLATPAWSIPLGVGPLWLDIVAGAMSMPLMGWLAHRGGYYVKVETEGEKVRIMVKARLNRAVPMWAHNKYGHNWKDKYSRMDHYNYGSQHQKSLLVLSVKPDDEDADEKVINAIVEAKECIKDMMGFGNEAAALANRAQKLLKS